VAPVPNLIWKPSEVSCQSATIETVKALVIAFLVCCPSGTIGRKQKHSHSYQTHEEHHIAVASGHEREQALASGRGSKATMPTMAATATAIANARTRISSEMPMPSGYYPVRTRRPQKILMLNPVASSSGTKN